MASLSGNPKVIKLLNRDLIEDTIRREGPITKPEIASITKLSLVTVNKAVKSLLFENKVILKGMNESTGGRWAQFFVINDELVYYIGLYYYKNRFLGAVSNSLGRIIYDASYPVRTGSESMAMRDTLEAVQSLVDQCNDRDIKAVGIGVPGVVKKGIVTNIPNIPGWEGKNLQRELEAKCGLPVVLENDINLTTLGVYHTRYRNKIRNMALLYLEHGIGAGIIINRELFKGATNFAGELSYIPVRNYMSPVTPEERYKGTFENHISYYNELLEYTPEKEHPEIKKLLLKTLADGLVSLICVLNPETVVIHHSCIEKRDMEQLRGYLARRIDEENIPNIVNVKDLSNDSIQGVINLCIRRTTLKYSLSNK